MESFRNMTTERLMLDAVRFGEVLCTEYKERLLTMGELLYYEMTSTNEIVENTFKYSNSILFCMVSKSIKSYNLDLYYDEIISVVSIVPPQVFIEIYRKLMYNAGRMTVVAYSKTEKLMRNIIKINNLG